jgi:hypothetical protein
MDDVTGARTPDPAAVVTARRGLHAVAEQLLAGPQWQVTTRITLAVTPDGFVTTHGAGPSIQALRVSGSHLIREPDGLMLPLTGTLASLGQQLGVQAAAPSAVYPQASDLAPDHPFDLTGSAAQFILRALSTGAQALREFSAGTGLQQEPILWPEHFDVGFSIDEVNYGVSPGDAEHDLPYAYVGPWTARTGAFWNEPFGSSIPLPTPDDASALIAFFTEGKEQAHSGGS